MKEKTPAEEEADATALEAAKDPLYAAGAFTLATALVGLGLFTGVWATKTVLGVDNVSRACVRLFLPLTDVSTGRRVRSAHASSHTKTYPAAI